MTAHTIASWHSIVCCGLEVRGWTVATRSPGGNPAAEANGWRSDKQSPGRCLGATCNGERHCLSIYLIQWILWVRETVWVSLQPNFFGGAWFLEIYLSKTLFSWFAENLPDLAGPALAPVAPVQVRIGLNHRRWCKSLPETSNFNQVGFPGIELTLPFQTKKKI